MNHFELNRTQPVLLSVNFNSPLVSSPQHADFLSWGWQHLLMVVESEIIIDSSFGGLESEQKYITLHTWTLYYILL